MKVLKENSEKIVIEMSKFDFNNLRNIFILNKKFCDEDLDKNEYDVAEKIVHLEDAEKGLFDEINKLLKSKK
jgi:hypothetical protein